MITKRYKIFEVVYRHEITFEGYSDGYGRESINNPVLKDCEGMLSWSYETREDAESAIKTHGREFQDYVILETITKT